MQGVDRRIDVERRREEREKRGEERVIDLKDQSG